MRPPPYTNRYFPSLPPTSAFFPLLPATSALSTAPLRAASDKSLIATQVTRHAGNRFTGAAVFSSGRDLPWRGIPR